MCIYYFNLKYLFSFIFIFVLVILLLKSILFQLVVFANAIFFICIRVFHLIFIFDFIVALFQLTTFFFK